MTAPGADAETQDPERVCAQRSPRTFSRRREGRPPTLLQGSGPQASPHVTGWGGNCPKDRAPPRVSKEGATRSQEGALGPAQSPHPGPQAGSARPRGQKRSDHTLPAGQASLAWPLSLSSWASSQPMLTSRGPWEGVEGPWRLPGVRSRGGHRGAEERWAGQPDREGPRPAQRQGCGLSAQDHGSGVPWEGGSWEPHELCIPAWS